MTAPSGMVNGSKVGLGMLISRRKIPCARARRQAGAVPSENVLPTRSHFRKQQPLMTFRYLLIILKRALGPLLHRVFSFYYYFFLIFSLFFLVRSLVAGAVRRTSFTFRFYSGIKRRAFLF